MATEVVMPQMGESIAEGTITKWMKNVGDHVDRDEPLFEISTDKVDAEIPSPSAGTLTEIRFKEGETVEVNTVVAVLDGANGAQANSPTSPAAAETKGTSEPAKAVAPTPQPISPATPPQPPQPGNAPAIAQGPGTNSEEPASREQVSPQPQQEAPRQAASINAESST